MRSLIRQRPAGPTAAASRGRTAGIGRATSLAAERVSDDLRRGAGDLLDHRRRVAALSLVSSCAMGVVAAYQYGLLRRLPEPPLAVFDADTVDASGAAYRLLRTPDAALGLVSYGVTLTLAGMGSRTRFKDTPLVPLAMAAKVLVDAVGGVYLTAEQATKHRRFCSWCLAATVASLASLPHVVPETKAAWRALGRR